MRTHCISCVSESGRSKVRTICGVISGGSQWATPTTMTERMPSSRVSSISKATRRLDHHGGELIAAGGADVNFLVGHGVEHGEHVDVLPVGHDESAEGVRVQALPAFLGADAFIGVEIAHALQCMRCWARVRAAAGRCG